MSISLADKLRTGLSPAEFIKSMNKNQEQFMAWHESFVWENGEDREFFQSLMNRDDLRCLILAADWCGDVVRNVPVVFRALEESGIPIEVMIKEQNMDVMGQFLTLGGESIPVVIFTDTGGYVLGKWGPRPRHVQAAMVHFKQENPDREATDYGANLKQTRLEIGKQYGEGTSYQTVIVKELRDLLSTF